MEIILGIIIALSVMLYGDPTLSNHFANEGRKSFKQQIEIDNTLTNIQNYCERYNCNETIIYNRKSNK